MTTFIIRQICQTTLTTYRQTGIQIYTGWAKKVIPLVHILHCTRGVTFWPTRYMQIKTLLMNILILSSCILPIATGKGIKTLLKQSSLLSNSQATQNTSRKKPELKYKCYKISVYVQMYNNFICNIKPSKSIYHSFNTFPSMVPKTFSICL